MKFFCLSISMLLLTGCFRHAERPLRTKVITFPEGGFVEVDGKRLGKEPVTITLPQNDRGQLTNTVQLRAIPHDNRLFSQTKILKPDHPDYKIRVPSLIMLDLSDVPESERKVDLLRLKREQKIEHKQRQIRKQQDRGKITRPVGVY